MKNIPVLNLKAMVFLLLLVGLISGCAAGSGTGIRIFEKEGGPVLTRIAVAPFQLILAEDPSRMFAPCPLCGSFVRVCDSPENSANIAETLFWQKLRLLKRYTVIPPDRVKGVYARVSAASLTSDQLEILKRTGKELDVDGVIAGYVFCYRERQGYSYSVEQPASVAMSVHLIRVSDGEIVWKGIYDKTQASLMENIFDVSSFIAEGGKWVAVEKLTELGINKILKTFPKGE